MAGMGNHGDGGITKLPNGRYRISLTMPDGRRVWRRARGERAANKALRGLQDMREADLDPSSRTLAEWLDRDGGAPRTVSHHRAVLRRALNVALRQRLVPRNVALGVDLAEPAQFAGSPLTLPDARRLLDTTGSDHLGPLWRLALDSGARQGELLGLGWDDFDPEAGTVTVTSQLMRRGGAWVRTPTKAARDSATIGLMPETVAALQAHRLRQASERQPGWEYWGHVFLTGNGQPYHAAEVLKAFKGACRRSGIAERRFHDLRASCATILRELGVPEEVRMARLGHATKAMSRHYAQVRPGFDREAVEAMRRALAG